VGSPKLEIIESSAEIVELLERDNNLNFCSIEILKKGIILRFRSILETFGLVISFHELVIYKGSAAQYSILKGRHKVSIKASEKVHEFVKKLMILKTDATGTRIEDL